MVNKGKFPILGVNVSGVDSEYAVSKIISCAKDNRPLSATALAVHGLMCGHKDLTQRKRLNGIDLVLADGQPIRWALNWLYGIKLASNIRGSDLTYNLIKSCADEGLGVYFYGSTTDCLKKLTEKFKSLFPELNICGYMPSKFRRVSEDERKEIIEQIKMSGAKIVFVGIGCPRQEVWIYEYRKFLNMPLIAVGAAFTFHAGLIKPAPKWMQGCGLEWLYRLMKEPKRLWKRYIILNPLYLINVLLQLLKIKKEKTLFSDGSEKEELYG